MKINKYIKIIIIVIIVAWVLGFRITEQSAMKAAVLNSNNIKAISTISSFSESIIAYEDTIINFAGIIYIKKWLGFFYLNNGRGVSSNYVDNTSKIIYSGGLLLDSRDGKHRYANLVKVNDKNIKYIAIIDEDIKDNELSKLALNVIEQRFPVYKVQNGFVLFIAEDVHMNLQKIKAFDEFGNLIDYKK